MRHDDDVLHLLRLGEAQDLAAEILRAVRPPDAAARDGAAAQVDALEARRVDENFGEGFGGGQPIDFAASELERDGFQPWLAAALLVEVGPERRVDEREQVAQDAILVEHRDLVERRRDAPGDLGACGLARIRVQPARRIEPPVEQLEQAGRDARMLVEHLGDVKRAVRRARLPVISAIGAKQRRLPPVEPGAEDQPVIAVVRRGAAPDGKEALFEVFPPREQLRLAAIGQVQAGVVQVNEAGAAADLGGKLERPLRDDVEAHVLEDRNARGERYRPVHLQQRGAHLVPVRWVFPVDVDFGRDIGPERLQAANVFKSAAGPVGFLIACREGAQIFFREPVARAAILREDALAKLVAPGADDLFDRALKALLRRLLERPIRAPYHEVDANHRAFGEERRERLRAARRKPPQAP